tara:strand:+ start:208 stop:1167 length:960 start_codon:yes stop_codon:yes gene_type:complete
MITKKVLIFGASGQVGRYCIRRLVKNNYKVTAVTRNIHKKGYMLKTQAPIGYLDIVETSIFDDNRINELISKADICLNLVGILFETKNNKFENIHSKFPQRLAQICKQKKVKFLHVSALGLSKAHDSKYASSKILGEKNIREILPEATIVKPSLVYSVDDNFTTKFMSILNIFPFFPLYYDGETKFTPIHVSDLAELIFFIISNEIYSKDIEAIGPEVINFKEILNILSKCINKKRIFIRIPIIFAKLSSFFIEKLPNPIITSDQLRLLKYDNIKSEKGISNFDIGCPSELYFQKTVMKYSYNWRDGGQFSNMDMDTKK